MQTNNQNPNPSEKTIPAEPPDDAGVLTPIATQRLILVEAAAPGSPSLDDESGTPRETLVSVPKPPAPALELRACLVHIYPKGPDMGARHALGKTRQLMGRDNDCDLCLADQSVSRHHARIQPGIDGYYVVDLNSTNGTFVNDKPASMCKLKDGDYLRLGNRIFRYLTGDNVETQYHEEIYRLTIIDALTGAYNKRYFLDFLDRESARSNRHHRPLSLVMFDIDRFKQVNDQMGHLVGDFALRELTQCIRDAILAEQLLARYGGEEFALIWPERERDKALEECERLRQLVEQHVFVQNEYTFQLTISMGVASTTGEEELSATDLIRQADERLYQAKQAGRNRVVG